MLSDYSLSSLSEKWLCRSLQIGQLTALLHPIYPSPSTLILHGPPATGKSGLIQAHLESNEICHAILRCRECITGRHLLERTVSAVSEALRNASESGSRDATATSSYRGRCENLGALLAHLQDMVEKTTSKFVLVFDNVDLQREAPPTLLPALARLGEYITNLTVVLIVNHATPRMCHQPGIPHVYFPPYSRDQTLQIVSRDPLDIFVEPPTDDPDYDEEVHQEDKSWLWPRFAAAVWDSVGQSAARDLVAFRDVCRKLWRPFVVPVIKGDFGTRDFSRLVVAQRRLFQDEGVLLNSLISSEYYETDAASKASKERELPYYAKWLIIAAYLASFNPARLDPVYFMKGTDRKRRKRGGGGAVGRPGRVRKMARHLLPASAFTIDRLIAILYAILPHSLRTTIDIYTQIATLSSLRLLVRSGGLGGNDPLEPGGKWRVGPLVSWEYVLGVSRSVDFNINGYMSE